MSAYRVMDPKTIPLLVGGAAAILLVGLAVLRIRRIAFARGVAWAAAFVAVVFAERVTAGEPPGLRMLAIVLFLFYAMKVTVAAESKLRLPLLHWLAFATLWPGMRPTIFRTLGAARPGGSLALAGRGVLNLLLGSILVALARLVWQRTGSRLGATLLLLPGLSLIVHFGLFNLVAAGWRRIGVDAGPLFKAPLLSRSLAEFWSRRWNLAFSEMTAVTVYRPVSGAAGKPVGLLASFGISGLLHEAAISLPVRAGYGLPFLYFLVHGGLVLAERVLERRGHPIDRRPAAGRAWVFVGLVSPLPLLFHPPFLRGVLWPLLGIAA